MKNQADNKRIQEFVMRVKRNYMEGMSFNEAFRIEAESLIKSGKHHPLQRIAELLIKPGKHHPLQRIVEFILFQRFLSAKESSQ